MTTILVVDDEPLIAMALEAELADAGYGAMTAPDGGRGWSGWPRRRARTCAGSPSSS